MSEETKTEKAQSYSRPKKQKKPKSKPIESRVPIRTWVSLKISQDKRLRREQAREIEVFLKKQGLGEMEEKDSYEKAFSKF